MEIAKNVRDFVVGMKDSLSADEDALLAQLQTLHEQYRALMEDFSVQVSARALSMSPEARVLAHELRLKLYQDWRTKLMERVFEDPDVAASSEDADVDQHTPDCDCCFCELTRRLKTYDKVMRECIETSTREKNPENDGDDSVFQMPDFLASS